MAKFVEIKLFPSPGTELLTSTLLSFFAILLLPYSIVGPFAGVLLDRWRPMADSIGTLVRKLSCGCGLT